MKRETLVSIVLAFIILCFIVLYFFRGISPGNSVIKKYSCRYDVNQFIFCVKKFCLKNSKITSWITDTTGTAQGGFTVYVSVELKNSAHDVLYSIACENDKGTRSGATIELVMAYDKINNIGGYNLKAKGIKPLVKYFDNNFIVPLNISENINITPL